MRCSESPTTSTAPSAAVFERTTREEELSVESFQAILGAIVMKPIAEGMGPMGAFFGDAIARAALERTTDDGRA